MYLVGVGTGSNTLPIASCTPANRTAQTPQLPGAVNAFSMELKMALGTKVFFVNAM